MKAWWRDASKLDLLIIALWVCSMASAAMDGEWRGAWLTFNVAFAWFIVADHGVELKRAKRLPPNSALVTAPVEPSSDLRAAARSMTEIRAALLEVGYTSEQAAEQIAALIRRGRDDTP